MFSPDLHCENLVSTVGYLSPGHRFPKGRVSQFVFERLVELVEHPFFSTCGYHTCDIGWCGLLDTLRLRARPSFRFKGRLLQLGNTDIIVPGNGVVYSAPTLILRLLGQL